MPRTGLSSGMASTCNRHALSRAQPLIGGFIVAGHVSEHSKRTARPRSVLLDRTLECLRDHCHDNTAENIAQRLGRVGPETVDVALQALEQDGFVVRAGCYWQLTRRGWEAARVHDVPQG